MGDLGEIQQLLKEVSEHLQAGSKADTRKAAAKLERIANIANTLRFTLQARQ